MRTLTQIEKELTEIHEFLLKGIPDQNLPQQLQTASTLASYLAFTTALVAEAGKQYNRIKVQAYEGLLSDQNNKTLSISLMKDYIKSKCGDAFAVYEFAQRINAAVTHTQEMLRTVISAEKALLTNLKEAVC